MTVPPCAHDWKGYCHPTHPLDRRRDIPRDRNASACRAPQQRANDGPFANPCARHPYGVMTFSQRTLVTSVSIFAPLRLSF